MILINHNTFVAEGEVYQSMMIGVALLFIILVNKLCYTFQMILSVF